MIWKRVVRGGHSRFESDIGEIYRASAHESKRFLPVWLNLNGVMYIANGTEKFPLPVRPSSANPNFPKRDYSRMLRDKGFVVKVGAGSAYTDLQIEEIIDEIDNIGIHNFVKTYCRPIQVLRKPKNPEGTK